MIRLEARNIGLVVGKKKLISDVNFVIESPKLVGIIGPNGAGKSTFLRIISGYIQPNQGSVLWNDEELSKWHVKKRSAICGYCPQNFIPSWDYSVAEIIALGMNLYRLKTQQLEQIINDYGLIGLENRRWSELSGGERARTMFAATLAKQPSLILADEPGASLDIKQRLALMVRLKKYSQHALIFIVIHDLDLALRFCDQLILLDKGKIVANASSENVFHSSAFKAAFQLNIQTERIKQGFDLVIGFDG
ncbi:ABC transporter ATP-binding protein (plasmid) [Bartonella sp. HY329]|uniref:ABC transporter ATP-binding protein n=1 Tax=unclassified Bartonella TaxID=2645622 RepID=UPI0021C7325B|nr:MULTISPECIES: ABC transporter ATP-binding protein [unclassified Bartonella]UXM96458.1 ABC transporter ATP-binding protein [Bartonella sp. HY329]UXN10781.1 ABC transporter ATP-binding protein [Bartonella sp. HY328]